MTTYHTIVADPPWPYATSLPGFGKKRSVVPYPTLTVAEIAALPVGDLAAKDAHLYLWTTNRHLPAAFDVVRAWGFKYAITLVWCKAPRGRSGLPAYNICTEYCLFCRRGTLPATWLWDTNVFTFPRAAHSQKPEHFLDMVEQVSPGPRLELFARRRRLGWDVWGNEVASTITLGEGGAA